MTAHLTPKVSFVVPCYMLGHLLADCVNSILSQTFGDFEILIMDDCSPDSTPEAARSFGDPRVIHVRNEPNLGHLANYNKGIRLARGEYVWLISPDDTLRVRYVLRRFVDFMDSHPGVGYVFCPVVKLQYEQETDVFEWCFHGTQDTVFKGRNFLANLISANSVPAPAALVRKECYEKVGLFPLDMPYAGDWYMWCNFALHYDVGYVAEPMVNYRLHDLNMTKILTHRDPNILANDNIAVRWRLKRKAEAAGPRVVVGWCEDAIIGDYVQRLLLPSCGAADRGKIAFTLEQFEESLARHSPDSTAQSRVQARVYADLGDHYYWGNELIQARQYYRWALQQKPSMFRVWAKYVLLLAGYPGLRFRETLVALRRLG